MEMIRGGPRMVLEKVKRRELCRLSLVRIVVLFFLLIFNFNFSFVI